jgi:opacity protein-like surface antigen
LDVSTDYLGRVQGSGHPAPSQVGSASATGGTLGALLGCDYALDRVIVGGRVAANLADASGEHGFPGGTSPYNRMEHELKNFGSVVARGGYLFKPDLLGYVVGGLAWANTAHRDSDPAPGYGLPPYSGSKDLTQTGWTLGAGIEYRVQPRVSVFLEYNYADFGETSETIDYPALGRAERFSFEQDINLLTVGVTYRF